MLISDWSSDVCSSELFSAILGREDEAEVVPVVGAAFLERIEVGGIGLRPVGLARLAIAAHAIALDVAQVLGERLRAGVALVDQQRLDGPAPRPGRQLRPGEAIGRASCRVRVWQYVYISVVAVSFKNNNNKMHTNCNH